LTRHYRVALDIGGTFTDVVAQDSIDGSVAVAKSSTTDGHLVSGILSALDQVVTEPGEIEFLVHGTTQGLNALLQRTGDRVLLLATEGLGDVYHIARGSRDRLYDNRYHKPPPLLPRSDTMEIGGRIDAHGRQLRPLDVASVRRAAAYARSEGITSIAVALLFSYLDASHELAVADILRVELGGQVSVSLSHQLAREWREYERTSSTVAEAYIAPTVRKYLEDLQRELDERGLAVPVHIMQSSGGFVRAEVAREHPLPTLLSGPVGCALGGVALSTQLNRPNLICVDMGGTSFDVSLVVDGRPELSSEAELEGLPLLMPVVNIHTIGAGGGSIAHVEGGGLRVGPASAGAQPGPACYGRGGTAPTVTDANLWLGRIDPGWFAGGQLALDREASRIALAGVAEQLDLTVDQLAEGICAVANAKMAQAIRTITVARGLDPKDFCLVAVGGAGALHAAFLALELGIAEVIIPPYPGTFSAWGMLSGSLRHDESRPFLAHLSVMDRGRLAAQIAEMQSIGAQLLSAQGAPAEHHTHQTTLDLRYADQAYTLSVPVAEPVELDRDDVTAVLSDRFHHAHLERFGHFSADTPVEVVTVRVTSTDRAEHPATPLGPRPDSPPTASSRITEVAFDGHQLPTAVLRRDELTGGRQILGPAIVLEDTATTVIPPHATASLHDTGSLILTLEGTVR
jgi:N-methylhydantoinase A